MMYNVGVGYGQSLPLHNLCTVHNSENKIVQLI